MIAKIKLGYDNHDKIKELFSQYTQMLVNNDSSNSKYLEL